MADYISRKAALEAITTAELGQEYEAVEAIPAADVVEVVHGEWTLISSPSILYNHYRCSECGEMTYDKSLYCPNCGAKMGGERKGGDGDD